MKSKDEFDARLVGPCNSVPTIFHQDGTIDYSSIRHLIDFSIDRGCDVIMLTWGDSLISLLTDDEVTELHRVVIDQAGERAVTIACDNIWGRNKAVEFGRYVRELGFDIYMVRPAEWAKGTAESLAEFYTACGRESPVMFVGDVPLRTLELLADDPNMWAFKEDLGLDYAHEIIMRWGDRWPMIGGGGMKRHHLLWAHGHCDTWLDGFCRTFPAVSQDYWRALQRGDIAAAWAQAMQYEVPLRAMAQRVRYGPDGLVKHAMVEAAGVAPRWRRAPAANPTEEEMDELREFLAGLGPQTQPVPA